MRVHQNIVIDGADLGDVPRRKDSKFYNEGKWDNFIAPLLPEDCSEMTFVEMGCNAGMFLRLAKERGFNRVVGIEKDEVAHIASRKYLRGLKCELINERLTENFDYDLIPSADVILLSNFHYWVFFPAFLQFVNMIRRKTRYVIIVSAKSRYKRHYPDSDITNIRKYFRLWEEVKHISPISTATDPRPREMFSSLFQSELIRMPIGDIEEKMGRAGTAHYKGIMREIARHGYYYPNKNPVQVRETGRIVDGSHRLATLRREGFKTAITEIV